MGFPQQDWQRMSTQLIKNKGRYKESCYGAYVVTRKGTIYPDQPDSFSDAGAGANRSVWTFSVLHNTTFLHGGPTFVNVFNSEILRSTSGDSDARITVRSHPLPFTKRQANLISSIFNFGAAIIIIIAYSFIPASQVQFIVREREVAAKYQQIISGVSLPAYWLANYVYDVCWYAIPGALAVVLIAAFDIREWIALDEQRGAAVVGVFALYGLSVTSSTYLLSWCFSSYSTASNVVLMLNLGASFITMCVGVGRLGAPCARVLFCFRHGVVPRRPAPPAPSSPPCPAASRTRSCGTSTSSARRTSRSCLCGASSPGSTWATCCWTCPSSTTWATSRTSAPSPTAPTRARCP